MAGDWIKMRSKLHDDPTVMRIMTATGLDRFAVVGRLHAFWSWTDEHADIDENGNGHVTGIALQHIDSLVTHPGFADALVLVGWLEVDGDKGLNIPRYALHNGDTAKKRAQGNKRVQKHRERNADVTQLKRAQRNESVTREEKRREEPPIPPGFAAFWSAYPASRRVGKGRCLKAWATSGLERRSGEVVAHVEAMKQTPQWTKDNGEFAPTSVTYLSQQRFEDGVPERGGRLRAAV